MCISDDIFVYLGQASIPPVPCACTTLSRQGISLESLNPIDLYLPSFYSSYTPLSLRASVVDLSDSEAEVEYETPFVMKEGTRTEFKRILVKLKVKKGSLKERKLNWLFYGVRFVYNEVLTLHFQKYDEYHDKVVEAVRGGMSEKEAKKLFKPPPVSVTGFNNLLKEVKEANPWLTEPNLQIGKDAFLYQQTLQQAALQAKNAVKNFVSGKAGKPHFKSHLVAKHNRAHFPQNFKINVDQSSIEIPSIGWFKFFNSGNLEGEFREITVCREPDGFFVSVLCKYEHTPDITTPTPSKATGIDVGVVKRITLSDGTSKEGLNERLKPEQEKLAKLQCDLNRKEKRSRNRLDVRLKIARVHRRIANIRADVNNKDSARIVKQYDIVCVEALRITNMTKSASGTIENPGKNVRAKSGLNRSIRNQGWGDFFRMLEYKLLLKGGILVRVNPRHTSQLCPKCGHISPKNRKSQACFECEKCHYVANADVNAATNILRRGLAALMESFPSLQF